jgi:anthranilate 1,2-dioxygenase (deaminating, decarboxylating) large subunit
LASTAVSYELPSINLGFTSFLDGGPPAGSGWYYTQYLQNFSSDSFANAEGDSDALFPDGDPDLAVWAALCQLIYQSDQPFFLGAKWGFDLILPVASIDVDFDGAEYVSANDAVIGDLLVGPYLQWDPIMGENGPIFMHRVEFQLIFPTGKYERDSTLNPGSNYFSFNPYWAGTLFITPKLTSSLRLHYLYNTVNDEPGREYAPGSPFYGVDEIQAGQAIHMNFSAAYEVVPNMLRLGINGYYLNQITNSKADEQGISDTREKVFAIGPGAVCHLGVDDHIFLNAYFEGGAENRPEGTRIGLRWVHHFSAK